MYLNPEEQYFNAHSQREAPLNSDEYEALDRYVNNEKINQNIPKPEKFTELYSGEEIERDKAEVTRIKKKLGFKEQHERALLAARILETEGESSDWFGDSVFISPTAEYDDVINHCDFVLEFEDEEDENSKHLAVDVTVSENPGVFSDKFSYLKKELVRGSLTVIKYFESQKDGSKHSLKEIPRVIIQISKEQLSELASDVLYNRKNIELHPVQYELLEEIQQQLEDQIQFVKEREARYMPKERKDAVLAKLTPILETIKKIEKEKGALSKAPRSGWKHSLPRLAA